MRAAAIEHSSSGDFGANFRATLFVVCLLVVWISLSPFVDLSSPDFLDDARGSEFWTYAVFALLSALCSNELARRHKSALRALATPANIALLAWIGVAVATSTDVSTSFKRSVLLLTSASIAASLFWLPRDRDDLARLLAITVGLVIGLSYFGVLALPDVSIHHATDLVEPQLDGDWRGIFGHKNIASPVFSMFVFIGVYVIRSGRGIAGAMIVILSAIFVLNSGGKSSIAICALTVVISYVAVLLTKSAWAQVVVLIAPLAVLLVLGVGSVISPELRAITAILPLDETFTGRTDIWRFAIENLWKHPLFGYGFAAFWNTDATRISGVGVAAWAGSASHAHNAYLDAALGMGIPGLALTLWAFVLQPLRDLRISTAHGGDAALRMLMLQLWILGLYLSAFETVILERNDPTWVTFLFAVFALRYFAYFGSEIT